MRRTLMATIVAALVVLPLGRSAPAQAATYPAYANKYTGECLQGRSTDVAPVLTFRCDNGSDQDWEVESRPQRGTSNDVVKLRNVKYNRCIDSHAGVNNDYFFNISCNTGNWQLWEVFYNSNGTRTFKSWGAWTYQGLHLCLSSDPDGADYAPLLRTCNRNSSLQQWTRRT
jgi:Ricin-type beta-trefoil lectin domain